MNFDAAPPPGEDARWAYIALGSNLGDSRAIVLQAIDKLRQLSDQPLRRSSLWQTEPVGCPPGSAAFVNAVAGLAFRPEETPESLLAQLQQFERDLGRQPKSVLNEPRPLDLDLIAFEQVQRTTSELVLPHPRAQGRRFVLQPLAEIAPDLVLPGQSQCVRELLASLPAGQRVRRLSDG